MADAVALPLTREQIDEWIIRGDMTAFARAALDLADEVADYRRRIKQAIECLESQPAASAQALDGLRRIWLHYLRTAEPDRG